MLLNISNYIFTDFTISYFSKDDISDYDKDRLSSVISPPKIKTSTRNDIYEFQKSDIHKFLMLNIQDNLSSLCSRYKKQHSKYNKMETNELNIYIKKVYQMLKDNKIPDNTLSDLWGLKRYEIPRFMMDKKLTLVHNDKIALEKETDINFDLLDFSLKNKLIYNNSFQQFFFIIETESFIM